MLEAERNPPAPYKVVARSSWPRTAWSPPANRWRPRSGSTSSSKAATPSTPPSPTNAAMGLMEPMSCGIGGDLFAIVWDAKTQKLYGLNASGRSPYKATRELFADKGLARHSRNRPAELVGARLRRWLGRASPKVRHDDLRARLLQPSIDYAEEGFPGQRSDRRLLARRRANAEPRSPTRRRLISDRRQGTPRAGEVFKNPLLARLLSRDRQRRPRCLLQGRHRRATSSPSPTRTAACSAMKDFAEHTSTWVDPVNTTYRGYDVWEIPPPGQGIAVLADAQHPRRLRPEEASGRTRPTTGTCLSRRRSSPTPTGPGSTPTRSSPRLPIDGTDLAKPYAERASQADRHE